MVCCMSGSQTSDSTVSNVPGRVLSPFVVTARLPTASDDAVVDSWIVDTVSDALGRVRDAVRAGEPLIVVTVDIGNASAREAPSTWRAAAGQASLAGVRFGVQSLALEVDATRTQLNVVLLDEATSHEDVDEVLHFLAGPSGGFSHGATFDLRGTR